MWWSEGIMRRRPRAWLHAGAAALLLLATGLGACGYRPLYGQRGPTGAPLAAELAAVKVVPIADRQGQQLYNFLVDRLSPGGRPAAPSYLLRIALTRTKEELGFREDETATRANLTLSAKYQLLRASDGAVMLTGASRSTSSYDIIENPFATLVSENDALDRAARELSEEIRTRLAVFLSDAVAEAAAGE